uniref:PIP49_C domain-containing protein n=1 Tax=Glossina brevipalpis TaxID=37001 RepID=A0A1A9W3W4_9MUSC
MPECDEFATIPKGRRRENISYLRLSILLIVVINTLEVKISAIEPENLYKSYLKEDSRLCTYCFESQLKGCEKFYERITDQDLSLQTIMDILPKISSRRNIRWLTMQNTSERIVCKYLFRNKKKLFRHATVQNLRNEFFHSEDPNTWQYCPNKDVESFLMQLKMYLNLKPETSWFYALINVELLLMPVLYDLNFPVPKTWRICGFTLIEDNAGQSLHYFYRTNFFQKLEIARQLLEATLKFSNGFSNYRLYVTDLTADNIIYDITKGKLFLIDLDSVFIVDSSKAKYNTSVHRYEYEVCEGCFSYSPLDICDYNISDVNIFLACQFLTEDLYRRKNGGFLYPIPQSVQERYPNLEKLLYQCVRCTHSDCQNRFDSANNVINLIKEILLVHGVHL